MYNDIHFRAMNTDVNAWLWSNDQRSARRALNEVEQFFHAMHARFTRFEPTSELSALNVSAGLPFAASPEMFEAVKLALKFSDLTGGLFNPTIIGALEAAGYDRTFEAIKETDRRPVVTSRVSAASSIILDATHRTITLPIGVRIDLGGIVKGWTVQRATQQLAMCGPCLVDAGGDIMTIGAAPDTTGWSIDLADPLDHEHDATTLRIRDRAVATSGIDRRRWQGADGTWQHHLIDPRTGQPSDSDLLTATVIAPATIDAEVYAKTVFLLGSEAGLRFVNGRPSLAACVITADGEVALSNTMKEYLDVNFTFSSTPVA
jgi:thiamine biosynthesis lipoprotein